MGIYIIEFWKESMQAISGRIIAMTIGLPGILGAGLKRPGQEPQPDGADSQRFFS
jgi:hypothetical protein